MVYTAFDKNVIKDAGWICKSINIKPLLVIHSSLWNLWLSLWNCRWLRAWEKNGQNGRKAIAKKKTMLIGKLKSHTESPNSIPFNLIIGEYDLNGSFLHWMCREQWREQNGERKKLNIYFQAMQKVVVCFHTTS